MTQLGTKGHVFSKKLTIAQINAGYIGVEGRADASPVVDNIKMVARGGAVGAVTTIDVQTTEASPTTVATFAQAQLTQNTALQHGSTGCTATNIGETLAKGTGLRVIKAGSDITTATHVHVVIDYHWEI